MKNIKTILITAAAALTLASCNDYLDINPENSLPTEKMWSSKSDVESALFSGYYNLREAITTHLLPLGELRAGCIYRNSSSDLEKFQLKSTSGSYTDWKVFYKIIADANGVIKNVRKAQGNDETYRESEVNSHLCEAYFLRALAYFYIVKNWRDAPLLTEPFETDEANYYVEKSSEAAIIAQIKQDLNTAISLGAAKTSFDTTWETKGRATVWALYALMSDVCLWNHDYDDAIKYADMLLQSKSDEAPAFIETANHSSWFAIFNPGNSKESIFELQYSALKNNGTALQTNTLPYLFPATRPSSSIYNYYMLSAALLRQIDSDANNIGLRHNEDPDMFVRTRWGTTNALPNSGTPAFIWKYIGGSTTSEPRTASNYDPNFIIYRVSEVMLIKAEALLMREMGANPSDNERALELINKIRKRTNLQELNLTSSSTLTELVDALLYERLLEFVAEGKAWYDLLRMGRYTDPAGNIDFVQDVFITNVQKYNAIAGGSKIKSTLLDKNAWYLPINETEITRNPLLVQNPYYE